MADFSPVTPFRRTALTVAVRSYWQDHQVQGQPVLPAVEAMQLLAMQARQVDPRLDVLRMSDIRFAKFMQIDPNQAAMEAYCDIASRPHGGLNLALVSKRKGGGGAGITRTVEHATMGVGRLCQAGYDPSPKRVDFDPNIERVIDAQRIYADLVPFGPAFRSIKGSVMLSRQGALAHITAPDPFIEPIGPLGSSFPLDGAFHAACVWGQVYTGVVVFPVGIDQRIIVKLTQPAQGYHAQVKPVQTITQPFIFNIYLYDFDDCPCEVALGVRMRDVSQGRWKPPAGVFQPDQGF